MRKNIVICSRGDYPQTTYARSLLPSSFDIVAEPEEIEKKLAKLKPDIIFFLFWSWKIPVSVIKKYTCISFHAADLPEYRGGSPIQNQILDGLKKTKLTAFMTSEKMDEGTILLKKDISLEGNLKEIMDRITKTAITMITELVRPDFVLSPKKQEGCATYCKRRTPEMSEIKPSEMTAEYIYNLVRCLNMPPYPPAFIRCKDGKKLNIIKVEMEK